MKRGAGTLALLSVGITGFLAVWWLYQLDVPAASGRDEEAFLRHIFGNGDLDLSLNTERAQEMYIDDDVFEEPVSEESHFLFLETTCLIPDSEHGNLTAHALCSVEAAAAVNLDVKVFLLYTCDEHVNSTLLRKLVLSYPNVRLWQISMKQLVLKTPLENWNYKKFEPDEVIPQLLSLFRYGGTYLDLGVILVRSLEKLRSNFISYKEPAQIIVLNLQSHRDVIRQCLLTIHNGETPISAFQKLKSQVLKKSCNITQVSQNSLNTCSGVNILPVSTFFPLPYDLSQDNETITNATMEIPEESFGIYIQSKNMKSLYHHHPMQTEHYCPEIYKLPDPEMIFL